MLQLKTPASARRFIPLISKVVNPFVRLRNRFRLKNAAIGKWNNAPVEELAKRVAKKEEKLSAPHIVHDEVFLKWRFRPIEGIRNSPAVYVYEGDESSFAICSTSGKVLNLYDFAFSSIDTTKSFIRSISRSAKASTIKILANSEAEVNMFRKLGFISFRTRAVITAYSRDGYFDSEQSMHVTLYDGDGDI
jgi:hypothetical protein